jgi:ABC-type ATPase involved in cell division
MTKVENLKKVTLRLEAGTTVNNMNLSLPSSEFEFIFGIGPGGMCPFEYQLFKKP